MSYLKEHSELLNSEFLESNSYSDVNSYLEKQSQAGTWCDEIMLRALGDYLHMEIHILHNNGHLTKLIPYEKKTVSVIFLGRLGERHYISVHKH